MQSWYPLKEESTGKKSIVLRNSEGKQWVFPIGNVKTGMNIYQPSSLKGKGIKLLLPYIKYLSPVLQRLNINVVNLEMVQEIEEYLNKIIGSGFQYSVFYGTPSPNQKITIQLNQGKKCIAYVKLTGKEHIWYYFQKEYNLLKELEQKRVAGIPKALAIQKIGEQYIFVQSGDKDGKEKAADRFEELHYSFLKDIWEKTKVEKSFSETGYFGSLEELRSYEDDFSENEKKIIRKGIEKVKKKFAAEREYAVYHGDFTPWNMYIKDGKLQVFDFEYAQYDYPKFLDIFHFHTQVWNLAEHRTKEEIWNLYCKNCQEWQHKLQIEDINIYYMAYLLEIIRLNKGLEKETKISISKKSYELWIYLLGKLKTVA